MKQFLFFSGLILYVHLLSSCNKDESENDPAPPQASMEANVTIRDGEGGITTSEWSVSSVSAVRQNGDLIITGIRPSTDEIFTLRIPDDGVGYYTNTGPNGNNGYASWRENSNAAFWYSNVYGTGSTHEFIVDLEEMSETISGTFYTVVNNPANFEANIVFQNGVFANVPVIISDGNEELLTENEFNCKVNGINFNPQTITSSIDSSLEMISVKAINSSGTELRMALPYSALTSDSFTVEESEEEVIIRYQDPGSPSYRGISGKITIESHNQGERIITGSFNFDVGSAGITNFNITEGSFGILY